jgi:hypothetical protein
MSVAVKLVQEGVPTILLEDPREGDLAGRRTVFGSELFKVRDQREVLGEVLARETRQLAAQILRLEVV